MVDVGHFGLRLNLFDPDLCLGGHLSKSWLDSARIWPMSANVVQICESSSTSAPNVAHIGHKLRGNFGTTMELAKVHGGAYPGHMATTILF